MKILKCPVCKGFGRYPDDWESVVLCQECNAANQAQAKLKVIAVAGASLLAEPVTFKNFDLKKPHRRPAWLRPIKDH